MLDHHADQVLGSLASVPFALDLDRSYPVLPHREECDPPPSLKPRYPSSALQATSLQSPLIDLSRSARTEAGSCRTKEVGIGSLDTEMVGKEEGLQDLCILTLIFLLLETDNKH